MRAFKSYVCFVSILILLVASFAGCGDTTRNDQGVSFSFVGWFADTTGDVGYSFGTWPLSFDQEAAGNAGYVPEGIPIYAGLENHLTDQFIRVDRIRHSYYIAGASVQPPDSSIAAPMFLEAVGGTDDTGTTTTESKSIGYIGTMLVTPDVMTFINLNRLNFPEPPFVMIITSYATGVTSAGKRMDTNRVEFSLTFTHDTVIPPGASTGTSGFGEDSVADDDAEGALVEEDEGVEF